MDIVEIPEAEEDYEADYDCSKGLNSQMELDFHRMATDYGDEEQAYDLYLIEEVFKRFANFAISLSLSFILIQLYLYEILPIAYSVLPLLILELKLLAEFLLKFKDEYEIIPNIYKSEYFIDSIESIGNIISYILLIIFLLNKLSYLSIISIPWILTNIFKLVTKANLANICISLSSIVRMFSSWIKIFTLILFGFKIDNFLSYSWKIALIPIYISILLCLIICIASIILIFLQYITGEKDKNAITANLWLIYSSSGGIISVISIIINIKNDYLIIPIIYIISFSIITRFCQRKLAYWWWEFFISEMSIPVPLDYKNLQLNLPESQKIFIGGTFTEKLKKAIILTPKALVKLANPQIQTRTEKIVRKKHNRSSSHAFELKSFKIKEKKQISRSKSMAIAAGIDSLDLSRFQNLCKFCFREIADCKFVNCGHGGVCMNCGDIILKSKRKCYICEIEIIDIIKEELDIENNMLAVIEGRLD
ncbi:hypothetical protein SteCoe_10215 [Stentor coeruleus]|uniref:RING-type domain-containing protein n=1 Tax=Stentor coeruleus TaxID=5963 RepID=A0A1R2CG84_9CILI|nr:hypothetical protein SteCoe_10215 [Stentor coeruleus]